MQNLSNLISLETYHNIGYFGAAATLYGLVLSEEAFSLTDTELTDIFGFFVIGSIFINFFPGVELTSALSDIIENISPFVTSEVDRSTLTPDELTALQERGEARIAWLHSSDIFASEMPPAYPGEYPPSGLKTTGGTWSYDYKRGDNSFDWEILTLGELDYIDYPGHFTPEYPPEVHSPGAAQPPAGLLGFAFFKEIMSDLGFFEVTLDRLVSKMGRVIAELEKMRSFKYLDLEHVYSRLELLDRVIDDIVTKTPMGDKSHKWEKDWFVYIGFHIREEQVAILCSADELIGDALTDRLRKTINDVLGHFTRIEDFTERPGDFPHRNMMFEKFRFVPRENLIKIKLNFFKGLIECANIKTGFLDYEYRLHEPTNAENRFNIPINCLRKPKVLDIVSYKYFEAILRLIRIIRKKNADSDSDPDLDLE